MNTSAPVVLCELNEVSVCVMMNWEYNEGKGITQGGLCVHMSPLSRKSPQCIPAPSCVVPACPDGWGLKDANVHAGAADLPQRLTLHQWKWKPVNQQAAVALVPAHHSLWHCQPRQEHINHKHRPKHCAVGTAVSHPFIHLALTLTHTTYTQMMRWTCKDKHSWMPRRTDWHTWVKEETPLQTQFIGNVIILLILLRYTDFLTFIYYIYSTLILI